MITLYLVQEWYPEYFSVWLKEEPVLLKIAKELFNASYEEYLAEEPDTENVSFMDYVENILDDNDPEHFLEVLYEYAKRKGMKAVHADAYFQNDHDDYWTVHLHRIIPETKDDLQELLEVYMENNNMSPNLAELVIDKLVGE